MINGDLFVDNGGVNSRVDRWIQKSNSSIPVMFVGESCWSLFVDTNDRLYCSQNRSSRVIRNSFLGKINQTEMIAGNGTSGSSNNQLNKARGIFVDLKMTLFVADCANNRIQRFARGERNGMTVAGNGSSGTIDLSGPVGVILDGNGYLFINDTYWNRIVAEGPSGFRCLIGCGFGGMGTLHLPRSIHFDSHGNLLVMESGSGRLRKFLLLSNPCGKSKLIFFTRRTEPLDSLR